MICVSPSDTRIMSYAVFRVILYRNTIYFKKEVEELWVIP